MEIQSVLIDFFSCGVQNKERNPKKLPGKFAASKKCKLVPKLIQINWFKGYDIQKNKEEKKHNVIQLTHSNAIHPYDI